MKNISFLLALCLLYSYALQGQSSQSKNPDEMALLNACLGNNTIKVYHLLGTEANLNESREASFRLFELLQRQTANDGGYVLIDSEAFKTEERRETIPEDLSVFMLLLRAGADITMHGIEGKDDDGVKTTDIGDNIVLYTGSDEKTKSKIVYHSKTGLNALEYAKKYKLNDFVKVFDVVSLPLLKEIKDPAAVKKLIEHGADVNERSTIEGFTPLFIACQYGNQEVISTLLENGADPNLSLNNGMTPIFAVAENGSPETAQQIMKAGAKINEAVEEFYTPFRNAIINQNTPIVKFLLNNGVEADQYLGSEKTSALYYSAQEGYTHMLEILLKAGADPNLAHEGGQTPVCIAAYFGRSESIALLVQAGAKLDDPAFENNTPLMHAFTHEHPEAFKLLLESGADPNCRLQNERTALHFVVQKRREEYLLPLIVADADPNLVMSDGNTPLSLAVRDSNLYMAGVLLEAGADIHWEGPGGENLLFINDDPLMVDFLAAKGADINGLDRRKRNALVDALEKKEQEKVYSLMKNDADMEAANNYFSIYKTDKAFIKYLKENGAKFKFRDEAYNLEEPGWVDYYLVLKLGLLNIPEYDARSWPFSMGGAIGLVPIYKFKANCSLLLNFIGSEGLYLINAHVTPTLRYCLIPSGLYIGAGGQYQYILAASGGKDRPDFVYEGPRSYIAPYVALGFEAYEGYMELGYRVRDKDQPGIFSITFGFNIADL